MTTTPDEARELARELLARCHGYADAKIPWPHRKLHDAARALEDLAGQVEAWQKYDRPETWW